MPVNSQEQAVFDQLEAFHRPPLAKLQPFNARNLPTIADAVRAVHAKRLAAGGDAGLSPIPTPVAKIEHQLIPGPGRDILLRIYTEEVIVPADAVGGARREPAVAGAAPTVYEGTAVLSADGAQLGRIKEVMPDTFLVDRKMHRDLYIPFDAIHGIKGDAVELSVAAGDVDHQDWQKPPLL